MKLKLAVAHLLLFASSFAYAEVTSVFSQQTSIFFSEPEYPPVIYGRPVPEPEQIIVGPPETPITVENPNSARANAVRAKGGEPGTSRCDGAMVIANTSGRCQSLEYDKDMLNFFNTEGLACAREAGQAAFGFTPTRFVFKTGEGQVSNSRTCLSGRKYSTHSAGRALDVFEVDIYNGRAVSSVTMHRDYMSRHGHRTFYTKFRDCWKAAVDRARGSVAGSSGSGCLDYNHAGHHDHMHISLPPQNHNRSTYNMCST